MHGQATENCIADLDQLLRANVHCATGLKDVLNDERAALESQDTEALNETAANKQLLLSQLEQLERKRREICSSSGFGADPDAMEALVNSCDAELPIPGNWKRFSELAKECSELNMINGAIINLRRQQISGALSLIRGDSQDNETYSRNGRDTVGSAKRILAEI